MTESETTKPSVTGGTKSGDAKGTRGKTNGQGKKPAGARDKAAPKPSPVKFERAFFNIIGDP